MNPDDPEIRAGDEPEPDAELARLLHEWSVPAVPDSLDRRVAALYRSRMPRRPLWRRILGAEIRVPLPVAVALVAALVLALWAPWRRKEAIESVESGEPSRAAQLERGVAGAARSSLAGFEPVREMNVSVLPQGEAR